MINFNGKLIASETNILSNNRAFLYGDGIFETVKILNNRILFLEDHYFRLMSGMRIVRMEIPANFTMEYFEEQLLNTAYANSCSDSCRARITIFRVDGGHYLPNCNDIQFLIKTQPLENQLYLHNEVDYVADLYKDFYISKQLISSVKTTNKMIHITGSIFARENGFDNCLLLNENKNVVEALQGNIFMLMGNRLVTPPISDGCGNGIMRKQIIILAKNNHDIAFVEESISPFDLQKADELFITNVIKGIQPITKYRKKEFQSTVSRELVFQLNRMIDCAN